MERQDRAPVASFFAPERPVAGSTITLGGDVAHHARVRRVSIGERVRLMDGEGTVGEGTLLRLGKHSVSVEVESAATLPQPEPVHILVPVADRERMLWLAEKCVELGVASWRPVIWRRSRSVSPRGEGNTFQGKVRARMAAALEQSGGAWLPVLHPDATLERAIAAAPDGERLLLERDAEPVLSRAVTAPVTITVGPEGGVEPEERSALLAAGWIPAGLSDNVLRFETAGIAALAVVRATLQARTRGLNG